MPGTDNPLVSVVIPFLNAEQFLAEAVESVAAQTYSGWELLLVDDGSTDGSGHIARELASRDDRVRCLSHPGHVNRGLSASRNLGLRLARGELVAFLDADDVWVPEKLAEQVDALAAAPSAAFVFGPTEYWQSWQPAPGGPDTVPDLGVGPGLVEPPALLTLSLRSLARTPAPSNVMVRLSAIEEIGGFEEARELGMYEDQAFFAKLFLRYPVLVSERCWDRYRLHAQQMSVGRPFAEKRRAALVYFDWLERYLREQGVSDPSVRRALHQKRRRYRFPPWNRVFLRTRELRKSLRVP